MEISPSSAHSDQKENILFSSLLLVALFIFVTTHVNVSSSALIILLFKEVQSGKTSLSKN